MAIKEWHDTIIFMHKINKGEADKSYGIHVAQLAGLPTEVIHRAKILLSKLENDSNEKKIDEWENILQELPLPNDNEIFFKEFDKLEADQISPREALDIIYKMKSLRQSNE